MTARLDAKNDCYVAELPSLALKDVRIADKLVREHERMLTGGFYAEVDARLRRHHRPGDRAAGRSRSTPCGRSRCRSRTCWTSTSTAGGVHDRRVDRLPAAVDRLGAGGIQRAGEARAAPAHGPVRRAQLQPRRARARAARARATCSSRSRPTPTSSPAARRPSPRCS